MLIDEIKDFYQRQLALVFELEEVGIVPTFSKTNDTACATFSKDGDAISLEFNETFWNSLTYYERCFLFAHEIYHIMLNHGKRGKAFMESLEPSRRFHEVLNQAMDICINEMLKKLYFSQIHESMFPTLFPTMCDLKNCFGENHSVLPNQNFEYYYEKLLEKYQGEGCSMESLSGMFENLPLDILSEIADILSEMSKETSDTIEGDAEENEKGKNNPSFSLGGSKGTDVYIDIKPEDTAETLEEALKLIVKKTAKRNFAKVKTNWYQTNRRAVAISKSNIHVPMYSYDRPEYVPKLVIYADVSGSVASWSDKFFALVADLDENKYEIELYAWASYVAKAKIVGKKVKYNGAGYGTDIRGVFTHSKNVEADAVVVITDGCYVNANMSKTMPDEFYKNWFFFYTPHSRHNHPSAAKGFTLKKL